MLKKTRTITLLLLLIICTFFTYYNTLVHSNSLGDLSELNSPKFHGVSVKNIVAYSLEKQISFQGQEIQCPTVVNLSGVIQGTSDKWKQIPGTFVYIYSAFEDVRLEPYYYVRIIAMSKGAWNSHLYCQLQLNVGVIHVVEANITHMWRTEWHPVDSKTYEPILISCKLPLAITLAHIHHVAVTARPCNFTSVNINLWKVPSNQPTNNKNSSWITVCVKPLRFSEDITEKLVGWIEMNKILGADKIEVFVSDVHPRTYKLLEWYGTSGDVVHVYNYTSITDTEAGVWQRRREELIAYNDCLYRNVHTSRFVLPLDIDEIVVPRFDYTWRQLLTRLFNSQLQVSEQYASFSVRNAYFMDQFTPNTNSLREPIALLRNMVRSQLSPDGESGKSFVLTKNTLVVFNHYALKSLRPGVQNVFFVSPDLVQMNHYKKSCQAMLLPECLEYLFKSHRIYDPIINKYRKYLIRNIRNIYNLLKL